MERRRLFRWLPVSIVLLAGCGRSTPPPVSPPVSIPRLARTPSTDSTLFSTLTPEQSGIDFTIKWDKPPEYDRIFFSQNTGGGVCVGDVDADGWPDIYLTRPSGGSRLYRNLGGLRFEDVTQQAGLRDDEFWATGAGLVDIDNDGDLDLYACGYNVPNRLYLNHGNGKFRQAADACGLNFRGASVMMAFADYDCDGDLDGYLVTAGLPPGKHQQFRVKFVGKRPVVVDELREFWQLLYLPGDRAKQIEAGQFDHLFRNDGLNAEGEPQFTDVTRAAGIEGTDIGQAAVWWDYDEDGWPDLYVANDYWGPDRLLHNNHDGTFTDQAATAFSHTPWSSMGVDIADVNQDGHIDLMATDMAGSNHFRQKVGMGNMADSGWFLEYGQPRQYSRNALYINTGTPRFMEAAFMTNLDASDWTWTPRFDDLDNDGRIDVFITNGMTREFTNSDLNNQATKVAKEGTPEFFAFWRQQDYRRDQNLMFRNLGDLQFEDVSHPWGFDRVGVSFGAATGDLDLDGDLDIVVSNMDVPLTIYRNNSVSGNSLRLRLEGRRSNRQALGATIRIDDGGTTQLRYVAQARGWTSTSEPIVHFGVGDADRVRQVTIRWPSGTVQQLHDLSVDRVHRIVEAENDPTTAVTTASSTAERAARFAESPEIRGLNAVHQETPYDDYQRQPLLPYKHSQLGPGLAAGDLNGDGRDDFYVGGAARQAGRLLISQPDGYRVVTPAALQADHFYEDMGALLFDADGDADLDLYVVSGGVECEPDSPELQDRLYRNEQGEFQADLSALPPVRSSGSVVAAADYDRDGDLDLFVGGRVIPGQYPLPPRSFLLRNQGGRFADVTATELPEGQQAGLVTGACWSDANGDGWIDLLVAYEWGPIRLFVNQQGKLVERTREASLSTLLGWWNGIRAGDVDHDGDQDYVVANVGLNTKYHASAEHPTRIYYGDFDGTGRRNIVESEYEQDKLFPVRGKSCSTNAMPFLADRFKTFHDFGMAQLQEIYTADCLNNAYRCEATLLESGILLNDGAGRFQFVALPRIAQIAPVFGTELVDVNGDGHLDIYLLQNFFSPQPETGRMDGGVSLLLLGDGRGGWRAEWPAESGLIVAGDAKSLVLTDLNADGLPDFLVGVNNAPLMGFQQRPSDGQRRVLRVRLSAHHGPRQAIGARVALQAGELSQVREVSAGGGYLSQSGSTLFFTLPRDVNEVELQVRWPDGSTSTHRQAIDAASAAVELICQQPK